jgi:hypothetical protein
LVAGFYVPLCLALLAGVLEAYAHRRQSEGVRLQLEYFVVGTELCLGALSIALIALLQLIFLWVGKPLELFLLSLTLEERMLPPMIVLNVGLLSLAWAGRRYAIQNMSTTGSHVGPSELVRRAGTNRRISGLEVFVSVFVCAGLVSLNTLLFE